APAASHGRPEPAQLPGSRLRLARRRAPGAGRTARRRTGRVGPAGAAAGAGGVRAGVPAGGGARGAGGAAGGRGPGRPPRPGSRAAGSRAPLREDLGGRPARGGGWYVNGQGQTLAIIPAGADFLMGSPPSEVDHRLDERRRRRCIPRAYAVATTEVTWGQFF